MIKRPDYRLIPDGDATKNARAKLTGPWVMDYVLRGEIKPGKRVYLLLHGFQESGARSLKLLTPAFNQDALLLAPNGPFPMPRLMPAEEGKPESYKVGFSWYFYNPFTDEYFIDMGIAVSLLSSLLEKLDLRGHPMTVIGFSQGGYLAPFLAQKLSQVDHVVGLGCCFLADELFSATPDSDWLSRCRLDAVHGAKDERVDLAQSQEMHAELMLRGGQGKFITLAKTGHRIDEAMLSELKHLSNFNARV